MTNKMWMVPKDSGVTEDDLKGHIFTAPTSGVYQVYSSISSTDVQSAINILRDLLYTLERLTSEKYYNKAKKSKLYKMFK